MLTSSRPWAGMTHGAIINLVVNQGGNLRWPQDTPAPLLELGTACLDHDPAKRPTFESIVSQLEAMKADPAITDAGRPRSSRPGL